MTFKDIKLIIFDLDGTIWLRDKLLPYALELITYLQQTYEVVFYTNISGSTSSYVWNKLNTLGIKCNFENVYASSTLTSEYLVENKINNVYVIGSDDLGREIRNKGGTTQQDNKAEHLVVGIDTKFNYEKISIGLDILLKGGKFIVCNQDSMFPLHNTFYPGCGAMVGAIAYASERKPDICVGKPGIYGLTKIAKRFNITNKEMLVIGDSMESDIQMAKNYNCKAIKIGNTYDNENGHLLYVKNLEDIYNEFIRI